MKKEGILLSLLLAFTLLASLLSIPAATAQNIQDSAAASSLPSLQMFSSEKELNNYVQEQENALLQNSAIGPTLTKIKGVFVYLNPAFRLVMGIDFTVSWFFFLALFLFILLLSIGFNLLPILEIYMSKKMVLPAQIIIFALYLVLISSIRVPKFISSIIVEAVSKLQNSIMQIFVMVMTLIIICVFILYPGVIRSAFRAFAEKKEQKEKIKELEEIVTPSAEEIEEEEEEIAKKEEAAKRKKAKEEAEKREFLGMLEEEG